MSKVDEEIQPGFEEAVAAESLVEDINKTYERVFGSEDEFRRYFFNTPDLTPRDAQVRLGVYLSKLSQDPSERFWFMRRIYRGTKFPETSIHNLLNWSNHSFSLNGHIQYQIEAWKEHQPTDIELFLHQLEAILKQNLGLPAPTGEDTPRVIYQNSHPKLELSSDMVVEVVSAILGHDIGVDIRDYSMGPEVKLDTPQFTFQVDVRRHAVFGDYLTVSFPDNSMKIDPGVRTEYERYYQEEVMPVLIGNAIESLGPDDIRREIKGGMKSPTVLERMLMVPGEFSPRSGRKDKPDRYYAWGRCIDLHADYASRLGALPEDLRYMDHTFLHGRLFTEEQLWHTLFGTQFPGRFKIVEPNMENTAVVVRDMFCSPTHQRVLDDLRDSDDHRDEFIEAAEAVIRGYRAFYTDDFGKFTFPEGYQPVAVAQDEEDFAVGYRLVEQGIELCFQLTNEAIVTQVEQLQRSHNKELQRLVDENAGLEELKSRYLNE